MCVLLPAAACVSLLLVSPCRWPALQNLRKKCMVFFSSCSSVKFHAELLNYIDLPVKDIHGKQKQQKRTSTFFEFCAAESGILLCTDVAARGLDIPGEPVCQRQSSSGSEVPHRISLILCVLFSVRKPAAKGI